MARRLDPCHYPTNCQNSPYAMPARAVSYFIYYRVALGRESLAREQVEQLQARLDRSTGVRGHLLTKRGEPNLWMEVYDAVRDPHGFERELELALRESGFDRL